MPDSLWGPRPCFTATQDHKSYPTLIWGPNHILLLSKTSNNSLTSSRDPRLCLGSRGPIHVSFPHGKL